MKEFIISHKISVIILAAFLLAAICFSAGMLTKSSIVKSGNYISIEKAKIIALESVGVSSEKASFTKTELDEDDQNPVYEIEFYTGVNAYEFEINALNGDILEKKSEALHADGTSQSSSAQGGQAAGTASQTAAGSQSSNQNASSANFIGIDKAKSIALSQAGISASNATFTKTHLDSDDNMQIYEIEFISQNTEYEFEIDAYTGEILESGTEQVITHHQETHHAEHHNWN